MLVNNILAKAQTSPYGQKYDRYCVSEEIQQKVVKEVRKQSRGVT